MYGFSPPSEFVLLQNLIRQMLSFDAPREQLARRRLKNKTLSAGASIHEAFRDLSLIRTTFSGFSTFGGWERAINCS